MKKWRCTICGYIHEGEAPPPECPVCGAGPEAFEPVTEEAAAVAAAPGSGEAGGLPAVTEKPLVDRALFKMSYGLYIVTSLQGDRMNGQCANTVFQITSQPNQIALGINRQNLTHEYITASGVVGVGVLGQDGHDLARRFGYASGRQQDKFAGLSFRRAPLTGVPIPLGCLAWLEARVRPEKSADVGTHTLFVAEVLAGSVLRDAEPMTYEYFRRTK